MMWRDIRHVLLLRALLKRKALILKRLSPLSTKDSFRNVMALAAYFDLELHQIDVNIVFLNGNIDETIYMVQLENFVFGNPNKMVYKLKKSIYGHKQASR